MSTSDSIFVIAQLWIVPGQVAAFEVFERKAAQIMAQHGGVVERTVRTVDAAAQHPFEIHVLRFPSRAHFDTYRGDAALAALAPERAAAIAKTSIFIGTTGTALHRDEQA